MKELGIFYAINVVLNKDILKYLEEYAELAYKLGADIFHIGQPYITGRLYSLENKSESEGWILSKDELRYAYRVMRKLGQDYKGRMRIIQWDRDVYKRSESDNFDSIQHKTKSEFICGAGTIHWAINEKLKLKPCVMLPEEDFTIADYNEFKHIVDGSFKIDWEKIREDFIKKCCGIKINPDSVCEKIIL